MEFQFRRSQGNFFDSHGMVHCINLLASPMASVLPPGHNTKVMEPVFSSLRKDVYISVCYIDDSLLQGETYESCQANVVDTNTLFDSLGLTTHPEKFVVIPTQSIEFVGFVINSVDMTVWLTQRKTEEILKFCNGILKKEQITIREFAQLIGKLVATEPGVMCAPLYKPLEIQKHVELKLARGNIDAEMTVSRESIRSIEWWMGNLPYQCRPIVLRQPNSIIESDSGNFGFGARSCCKWTLELWRTNATY